MATRILNRCKSCNSQDTQGNDDPTKAAQWRIGINGNGSSKYRAPRNNIRSGHYCYSCVQTRIEQLNAQRSI